MYVMMKTILRNKMEINVGKWQTERIDGTHLFVPARARMRRNYTLSSHGILIEETYTNTGKLVSVDEYTQDPPGFSDVHQSSVDVLGNIHEHDHVEFMSHVHGMDVWYHKEA